MLRHREVALALTEALATRFREVLSADQYEVTISGLAVLIQRRDAPSGGAGTPALMLATPGPGEEKLRRVLELAAEMAKQYVAPEATARAQVTADALEIWWGGPSTTEAVVRLRPIPRDEVGL